MFPLRLPLSFRFQHRFRISTVALRSALPSLQITPQPQSPPFPLPAVPASGILVLLVSMPNYAFLRKEQPVPENESVGEQRGGRMKSSLPSVKRALPPVGWQRTVEHDPQRTTVCACEKTVVMLKHPGHLTSMKYELGPCTNLLFTA